MKTRFFDGQKPRMFAHRGASGAAPENTLVAFEMAVGAGADILEMDVYATRDGHIIVMHDDLLERTTNGKGSASQITLAELGRLDAGYWFTPDKGKNYPYRGKGIQVPTLREVIERFPNVPFNIEIKQNEPKIERATFELLKQLGHADITLLASEQDFLIERIRPLNPGLPTNFCSSEVLDFLQRLHQNRWSDYDPSGEALQIPEHYYDIPVLTPSLLEAAHRLGIEVHAWTINEEAEMRRLLKMGVDGIMTDYPERLTRVVRQMGFRK
ncbi:MAG: glycerophosphodiester phosphodiesterase [Candidatus Lindowbacteria bacterium]|nr:glycerophosphodiester phosphodiesterase [Candidatus Lindowbacteria bacterium]